MYGRLIVRKGRKEGQSIFLTEGKCITIGRGEESDIPLFDTGLSRKHFQVEVKNNVFVLTDLESTNGTFVNGQRITVWQLAPGDIVTAGTSAFELTIYEEQSKSNTRILCWDDKGKPAEYHSFRRIDLEKSSLMMLPEERSTRVALNQAHSALATLYKVGNLIQSEFDLQKVFARTMDAIMETIKADRGYLVMWDKTGTTLEPVVARRGKDPITDTRLTMSQTVLEAAVIHGHSLISADALRDDRLKSGESIILQHIRSVMCVPLQSKEHILGAIYLDCVERSSAFTQQDLELLTAIAHQAGIAIERAKLHEEMETLFYDCIKTIVAAIEAKDKYTHGHSERVTSYALAIAQEMGFTSREVECLQLAGLLHDVGKIGIPERILTKTGRLTPEEFEVMKSHPVLGAEMIRNIHNTDMVVAGIRWHHERIDGGGYPDKLKGEEIPILARVLCVADAYDAMTSSRPYRQDLTEEQVVEEVRRCRGKQFDGDVVDIFVDLLSGGRMKPLHLPRPSFAGGYRVDPTSDSGSNPATRPLVAAPGGTPAAPTPPAAPAPSWGLAAGPGTGAGQAPAPSGPPTPRIRKGTDRLVGPRGPAAAAAGLGGRTDAGAGPAAAGPLPPPLPNWAFEAAAASQDPPSAAAGSTPPGPPPAPASGPHDAAHGPETRVLPTPPASGPAQSPPPAAGPAAATPPQP